MRSLLFTIMIFLLAGLAMASHLRVASAVSDDQWTGIWFTCEFAGRTTPPHDECAMLDDDGFVFDPEIGRVVQVKVTDSTETDACKKQHHGQCFRADTDSITVTERRQGKAIFTDTQMGLRLLGCTQIFHATVMDRFIELRPDAKRCLWAREKYFYVRRYDGMVKQDE